ncbi:MAG TPA: aldo/keto reductase [Acidimicrobiia bacterium]|nr:aldo/keto reductase [Acidimicrobiia bacterium]
MRYRRFGQSDLVVSEVGFGAWTIAMNWWGEVDDPAGLVHAALDTGITFFDTAPVYGENGAGEEMLAKILGRTRSEIVLTTKCGYDISAPRIAPGHSERPHDWNPASVRRQLEESLRRLGTDYIDLYQLHNATIDPIRADDLWVELEKMRADGLVRELGVALGPAIGWVDEGVEAIRERPIVSLQTVMNVLEQEPGRTFLAEPNVASQRVGIIARVPHASDVLSGLVTRDTVFEADDHRSHRNRDAILDLLDMKDHVEFLADPDSGRTLGQAAIAGLLASEGVTTVLPTCTTEEQVREYAQASDLPLSPEERARLDDVWTSGFGGMERRAEPVFKSSV